MTVQEIEMKLYEIIKRTIDIDFENDSTLKDAKLLGSKIKLPVRELVILLYNIEKQFAISISKDALVAGEFDSYNNILKLVLREMV